MGARLGIRGQKPFSFIIIHNLPLDTWQREVEDLFQKYGCAALVLTSRLAVQLCRPQTALWCCIKMRVLESQQLVMSGLCAARQAHH